MSGAMIEAEAEDAKDMSVAPEDFIGDARKLTPIECIVQEFGQDFPAPTSVEDLMCRSGPDKATP